MSTSQNSRKVTKKIEAVETPEGAGATVRRYVSLVFFALNHCSDCVLGQLDPVDLTALTLSSCWTTSSECFALSESTFSQLTLHAKLTALLLALDSYVYTPSTIYELQVDIFSM